MILKGSSSGQSGYYYSDMWARIGASLIRNKYACASLRFSRTRFKVWGKLTNPPELRVILWCNLFFLSCNKFEMYKCTIFYMGKLVHLFCTTSKCESSERKFSVYTILLHNSNSLSVYFVINCTDNIYCAMPITLYQCDKLKIQ